MIINCKCCSIIFSYEFGHPTYCRLSEMCVGRAYFALLCNNDWNFNRILCLCIAQQNRCQCEVTTNWRGEYYVSESNRGIWDSEKKTKETLLLEKTCWNDRYITHVGTHTKYSCENHWFAYWKYYYNERANLRRSK